MIEPVITKFWLRPAELRAGITDSLLLGSGVEIISAIVDGKYDVFLRSCGDVRIVWKDQAYRDVSQFPDDLIEVIRRGALSDHPDAYVDMNNWYEVFVYDEHNTLLFSDLEDVDISTMDEKMAREIVVDAYRSALCIPSKSELEDWWRHNGCYDRAQASGIPYTGQDDYLSLTDKWWEKQDDDKRLAVFKEFFSEQ